MIGSPLSLRATATLPSQQQQTLQAEIHNPFNPSGSSQQTETEQNYPNPQQMFTGDLWQGSFHSLIVISTVIETQRTAAIGIV
jgi:hypothetical protein